MKSADETQETTPLTCLVNFSHSAQSCLGLLLAATVSHSASPSEKPTVQQAHSKISLLPHTTKTRLFRMRIYQQHPSEGTILKGSELSALLDLVIPSYDVPLSPIEMIQTHIFDSLVTPSPASVCQSQVAPLPVIPHQNVHGFEYFAVPSEDATTITPATYCNMEHFPCPESMMTSFLHGDPALSIEELQSRPESNDAQLCKLVTPLEVLLDNPKLLMTETKAAKKLVTPLEVLLDDPELPVTETKAVKGKQKLLQLNKRRPKCTVNGCTTQQQSHGRCIRHGGGTRCSVFGCGSGAQTRGLCKRHGGGSRCKVLGCGVSCQSGGLCRSHGGGMLCIAPGCKKGAQRQGKCAKHAPNKCAVDGCWSLNRSGGFCSRHKPLTCTI